MHNEYQLSKKTSRKTNIDPKEIIKRKLRQAERQKEIREKNASNEASIMEKTKEMLLNVKIKVKNSVTKLSRI